MNTKYLLRYLNSSFAADRACTVVRRAVAGVVRPDITPGCGGWDNSSCNGLTLSSCGTGRVAEASIHSLHIAMSADPVRPAEVMLRRERLSA